MAIDRARRARRRHERRRGRDEASPSEHDSSGARFRGTGGAPEEGADIGRDRRHLTAASIEVEGLFNAGAKHQLEQLEWVAVAREDERESGAGPLDLDSGIVRLPPRRP